MLRINRLSRINLLSQSAQLFIGRFREPRPPGRAVPRTIDASSGPYPEIPCPTTSLPDRPPKISVVHWSENRLFDMLQSISWASYPDRTAVENMRVDHGGAHILVAE
jgi:hypothetical protein